MDDRIFVERIFELDGGALPVRFYPPDQAPTGDFACVYSIAWPEKEYRATIFGVDGVQALMLAMRHAHGQLVRSTAYTDGKLILYDQGDLDLPPTWGTGPLYEAQTVPPGSEAQAGSI